MTIHSQCKNPIHSWNGKIMNIPVWKNTLKGRPNDFSVGIDEDKKDKNYSKESRHHTTSTSQMFLSLFDDKFSQTGLLKMTLLSQQFIEYLHRLRNSLHSDQTTKQTATGRYLRESTSRNESVSADSKRPIIMWGTHHKTGTFFAIKVFSLLCARESWCCRFHVSRDSIKALQHSLTDEMPAILGHNQWVWYPEEIVSQHKSSAGPVVSLPYRFVHFYRDPLQKVLSGYRYHKDGIEGWSRRSKQFANLCNSSLVKASLGLSKKAHANEVRSRSQNTNTLHPSVQLPASTQMISEHCHASYLCQSCCRREHEHVGAERLGKDDGTVVGYISRPDSEYAFLCSHLGSVPTNSSLSDALATKPRDSGLLIEAALDFYENLRMARIVNHTWNDPNT